MDMYRIREKAKIHILFRIHSTPSLLFIAQVTSAPLVSQVQPKKPKPDFLNVAIGQNLPLNLPAICIYKYIHT